MSSETISLKPIADDGMSLPSGSGRFGHLKTNGWLVLSLLLACGAGWLAHWSTNPWVWAGTVTAVAAVGYWLGRFWGSGVSQQKVTVRDGMDLPQQVLPVWKRNVLAARDFSEQSMATLLESFADVSTNLDKALTDGGEIEMVELDTADRLIEEYGPEIEKLLATTRKSVALKNSMLEAMTGIAQALGQMETFAQQVQEIGRATDLMALNASVEATRAGNSGSGFAIVATEVRRLASQSRTAATQVGKLVHSLQDRLGNLRNQVRRDDTEDDELLLQAEENVRSLISAMLKSLSKSKRTSRTLRESGRQVQSDIERIMMSLQSQDRMSQMLVAVCEDMQRMNEWINGAEDPTAEMPTLWLDRLEENYTMEEQRSVHHNTVSVERTAAVEFF